MPCNDPLPQKEAALYRKMLVRNKKDLFFAVKISNEKKSNVRLPVVYAKKNLFYNIF